MSKIINVTNIITKPESRFSTTEIQGRVFMEITNSPNVYVLETSSHLCNGIDIQFELNNIRYTLNDIFAHKSDNNLVKTIECKFWKEEVIIDLV